MLIVYSAGRTLAELSFWSWVEENRYPFVVNSVCPDGNFGRGLVGATSSNALLKKILAGDWTEALIPLGEYTVKLLITGGKFTCNRVLMLTQFSFISLPS
jgi:hypothetical protein